jgi:hypothetical protein
MRIAIFFGPELTTRERSASSLVAGIYENDVDKGRFFASSRFMSLAAMAALAVIKQKSGRHEIGWAG